MRRSDDDCHRRSRSSADAGLRLGGRVPLGAFRLPEVDWSRWQVDAGDEWVMLAARVGLPRQGWKIHCSSTVDDGQSVLDHVARFCHERSTAFKYVPSRRHLAWRNSKEAPAAAAAKFITVYPPVHELDEWVRGLHERIGDRKAPAILGDLRWRGGPVHVRYGGFQARTTLGRDGLPVPAIVRPDGRFEPDVRGTAFDPPAWVELPLFLADQRRRLKEADPGSLADYAFESAITVTAAGGIYRARRRADGVPVVLKEARPLITVGSGQAPERLVHEGAVLEDLSRVRGIVTKVRAFEAGGHSFLELDAIEGDTLNRAVYSSNPLVAPDSDERTRVAYRDRVLSVMGQLAETVRRLHDLGMVHGDLHPGNVMVDGSDRPVIVDFESAAPVSTEVSRTDLIGAHGYAAPATVRGAARDEYSLAAMTLNAFVPLSFLHGLDPELVDEHIEAAREAFLLDGDLCTELAGRLSVWKVASSTIEKSRVDSCVGQNPTATPPGLLQAARSGLSALVANPEGGGSRVPARFGPQVAPTNDEGCIGHLQALSATGMLSPDEQMALLQDARRPCLTKGMLGGLASKALLVARLRLPGADALVGELVDEVDETVDLGLRDGLAGMGVAVIVEHARNPSERTGEAIREISRRLGGQCSMTDEWHVGLLDGAAGIAIFHVAHAGLIGDAAPLVKARELLVAALRRCASTDDGRLEVRDGPRTLPFLGAGSAGLGVAILAYLEMAADDELEAVLPGIERACSAELVVHAGLSDGRAGMMVFLAELARSGRGSPDLTSTMVRHVRRLEWHALRVEGGVTFPSRDLDATSPGLAHGAAGVVIGLDAAARTVAGGDALRALPDYLFLRGGTR
ncbi:class III lanthionine synthetase LanKC [Frigoribacterium sp. CFBP 8751]|uniref:class III lanthionine synthetase LanKC n=1 Tax=Frigoribacterium sp. CFBP 8751 TaxID=2775277 RepID=UPI00237B8093|nr:class III lanthionine synthetase LanKC [Frigoribacterium sp. CFBP 8751]